ncbi:acyl-CoA dehydrogenase family protein [Streptomyces sp. NPDC059894]|uniref:acyl-CoA dehydrogenase family protein n=1 Tax=unclassified Streptomyces TaxID=2593676 RepID=UPI003659E2A5
MSLDLLPQPTDEQRMMIDALARILDAESPLEAVREAAERSEPGRPELRRKLGDIGCFGLLVDESRGGGSASENGVLDAVLVAAERGARLQPGPYVGTHVTAHTLSRHASTATSSSVHQPTLASLVCGETAATWATDGLLGGEPVLSVRADGDRLVVNGVLAAVQDADDSEHLLLSAPLKSPEPGVAHALIPLRDPRVRLAERGAFDITRRFQDVHLDQLVLAPDTVLAAGEAGRALLDRQIAVASVLAAAESIGTMDSDLRLAVEYAKTRIAFGRPIGSFQAVKHLLADTGLALEMAKSLVVEAATAVGKEAGDSLVLASAAKSFVGEKAVQLAHNCFQVFGGIGYTWEHDNHLFLRRLASDAQLFGTPVWHQRLIWEKASHTTRTKGRHHV